MKRRRVIRVYLMKSLKKRLWMVILPAVVLGTAVFLLTSSVQFSVPVTLLTALYVTVGVLWSSYRRHLGDFLTDPRIEGDDPFVLKE